jgi:hypothetical protein
MFILHFLLYSNIRNLFLSFFGIVVGAQVPYNPYVRRGVAQLGSASALGAEGRRFESGRPDQP